MPFGIFLKKEKQAEAYKTASAVVAQAKSSVTIVEAKPVPSRVPPWAKPSETGKVKPAADKSEYPYRVGGVGGAKSLVVTVLRDKYNSKRGKVVEVSVFCQSDRGERFGTNGGKYFDASNGYRLASAEQPKFYKEGSVYLLGTEKWADSCTINIPSSELVKFKQAVLEYNEFFKESREGKPKFKVGDVVIGNKSANKYSITKEGWKGTVTETRVGEYFSFRVKGLATGHLFVLDPEYFDLYTPTAPKPSTKTLSESEKTSTLKGGKWVAKVGDVVRGTETGVIVEIVSVDKDSKNKLTKCTVKSVPGEKWYSDKETGKEKDRGLVLSNKSIGLYKLVRRSGSVESEVDSKFDPYNPGFVHASASSSNMFLNYEVISHTDGIVKFRIIEQVNFTDKFLASDRFWLKSVSLPELLEDGCYVRGTNKSRDLKELTTSESNFKRFANACKEFNDKYNK